MHWTDRRQRFRAVLAGSHCVHPGSVFDPISARIAEELGFEVGMFAGSIASFTVLGAPDLIVLTLTEFAAQAYRINRAGKLPLLVDADHGYGNALNVMRTVQELETAGVAAMCIEDTLLPRTYGEKQPSLISLEEGVGKMRAAVAAREDPSFVIVGRTSAAAMTGTEDVVRRAKAYEAAGVDALFFAGGVTREQLDAIHSAVKLPLMMGGGRDGLDREYLASRRARCAARASAVLGRGAGGLQHAEGAARRDAAGRSARHRIGRDDAAGHAGRRLQELDGEVPGGLTGPLPAAPGQ
jgi:carboxyvinyl-carboxyphosphonate phosphorylmutase